MKINRRRGKGVADGGGKQAKEERDRKRVSEEDLK